MATIIDRRLNPRDKNLNNRQRFIQRAREHVRRAVNDVISGGNIKDIDGKNVKVPVKGTAEPTFGHDHQTGERTYVVPGNREFLEGDQIEKQKGESGGGGREGSPEGSGEDDFEFTLTKDEFYNFFFADLELPDLVKKQIADIEKTKPRRAGYTNVGTPAQLDIRTSMRNAISRRIALKRPRSDEIANFEKHLALLEDAVPHSDDEHQRYEVLIASVRAMLENAKRRVKAIPWIDPFDVRYRNYVMQPQPITKAVMFALMDVSGSMAEREKDIAKRFFMLLYMFLTRKYENVDIVFVRHHSTAEECNEHDFFHKRETGGTVVSSGLDMINDIIRQRYPSGDWNIYVAQASDGDNYTKDNEDCKIALDKMLPIVQYFAYIDIAREPDSMWGNVYPDSDLWKLYKEIAAKYPNMVIRKAYTRTMIWGVFKELFSKNRQAA